MEKLSQEEIDRRMVQRGESLMAPDDLRFIRDVNGIMTN